VQLTGPSAHLQRQNEAIVSTIHSLNPDAQLLLVWLPTAYFVGSCTLIFVSKLWQRQLSRRQWSAISYAVSLRM
jgi:hypothetical protein